MSEPAENVTSRYPMLEQPAFESTIPAHLLSRLTDQEQYVVKTVSKMEQQSTWLLTQMKQQNKAVIETDVRVQNLETVKRLIMSRYAIVAWFFTILVPIAIKLAIDYWLKKHWP